MEEEGKRGRETVQMEDEENLTRVRAITQIPSQCYNHPTRMHAQRAELSLCELLPLFCALFFLAESIGMRYAGTRQSGT